MSGQTIDALRREQIELRKRLDLIDARLKAEQGPEPEAERERGVTATLSAPSTGFVRPTAEELRTLGDRVYAAFDFLAPCSETALERAFIAIGHMFRLPEPSKLAFHSHVERVNDVARLLGFRGETPGNAVLTALICHNDVPWRAHAPNTGQMLECALDPYSGRPCSNAWKKVLAGAPLTPPLPPRPLPGGQSVPLPRFSVYQTE
jgi:hypothetical protein